MDINWAMYNLPNYDLTDLRQSKTDAWQMQSELADNISKAIKERKENLEKEARNNQLMEALGNGGQDAMKMFPLIAGLL